jgi:hypothetical protein
VAFPGGGLTGDPIVDALRESGMSDKDILIMVGDGDSGIFESLVWGARKGMGRIPSFRGITPEGVAQALSVGVSPLTLDSYSQYKGGGVFYWMGSRYQGSSLGVRGIISVLKNQAHQRTQDIVRKTRKEETYQMNLDAPLGSGEGPSLRDLLGDSGTSRALQQEVAQDVLMAPGTMKALDRAVRSRLTTDSQRNIWDAIRYNPDLLTIKSTGIGVLPRALAQQVSEETGSEYKGKSSDVSARKTFLNNVLPAMQDALTDPDVADRLMKNKAVLEVLEGASSMGRSMRLSSSRVAFRFRMKQTAPGT